MKRMPVKNRYLSNRNPYSLQILQSSKVFCYPGCSPAQAGYLSNINIYEDGDFFALDTSLKCMLLQDEHAHPLDGHFFKMDILLRWTLPQDGHACVCEDGHF